MEEHHAEKIERLQAQLEQAQVAERRARGLLDSAASLMGLDDASAVMAGIAENAVRHIDLERVRAYRVDYDQEALIEVARAERADSKQEPLPGLATVHMAEVDPSPIPLEQGDRLAEFALGGDDLVIERTDGRRVLAQMRGRHGSDVTTRRALMGILVAESCESIGPRRTRLLRALISLGSAAIEAARVEQFRAHLISAVSHELRTPLAAIRAYNELLLDGDAGEINEEQRLFLQRIEATCMRLDRMVEDLLDLSRLRTGEMPVRQEPVDVVATIEHIIDTLSPEAARSHVTLTEEIVGDLPLISSDPDRLAQVLFNLVGNAVKYVGEGGEVKVRARVVPTRQCPSRRDEAIAAGNCAGECLLIEVIDNGPGIAPDDQERVFDEFFRAHPMESNTKGSGLGLAISRRLVRLLGGTITLESTPGEGSTFTVIFPLSQVSSH